jgi:hypothetical protein
MKKRFFYYLLILAVLGGCATERKVVDNTFYCSFPKFTIRINTDYEYIGQMKYHSEGKAVNLTYDLRWDHEMYIFILADNNRVKKTIMVDIEKISTYYVSDFWGNIENKLESGVCELGGKKYHHYTKAVVPSAKWNMTRFVSDKGFILPNCLLTKRVGRIEGAKGNMLFKIYYYEDVTDSGYACRSWKNRDTLSKDRLDRLAQFDKNWHEAFEVLPFRKPPDSK